MIFHVILEHAEDGWVVAEVPALPGCVSFGETLEEAEEMAKEAIELYIESLQAHGEEAPR